MSQHRATAFDLAKKGRKRLEAPSDARRALAAASVRAALAAHPSEAPSTVDSSGASRGAKCVSADRDAASTPPVRRASQLQWMHAS
jgi:hypothetical protein